MLETGKFGGRRASAVLGAVAVAVGIIAVGALTAGARTGNYSIKAEDLVPEFEVGQTIADTLPDELETLAEEENVEMQSVRLIAKSEYGSNWTAQNARDEICLLTMLTDESVWAIQCTDRPTFYLHGASQALGSSTAPGVEVHLLPAGVADSSLRSALGASVAEQAGARSGTTETATDFQVLGATRLVVLSIKEAAKVGEVSIPRDGQEDLVVYDLGSPQS